MGKKYSITTQEERKRIKTLLDMGVSEKEVVRISGRSTTIVHGIATGTYEAKKEADRIRLSKARKAETEKDQKNVIRQRIREEALKAGAPTFDDDEIPVEAKLLPASPFSYDTLLRRVADSTDYTNALLNGVLNRLEALCKALGVIA